MQLNGVFKPFLSLLTLSLSFGLISACGDRPNRPDRQATVPPTIQEPIATPTPAPLPLVQDCSDELKDGASRELTLYRKEFAALGETCESLAFSTKESCAQGQITFAEPGARSCEETTLESVSLVSPVESLVVGESHALVLEGIDNRGGKIVLDNKKATWTSSNDFVSVSSSGVVSGRLAVTDLFITARFEKLSARVELKVTGRSCGETADGSSLDLTRFTAERVAFNAKCEAVETKALCENGEFTHAPNTYESCEPAKLSRLEASPAALFIKEGETALVELYLHDEIGTKALVPAADAVWNVPADSGLLLSQGRITAARDLREGVEVTITASGLQSTVLVKSPERKPELIGFVESDLLLKVGDERTLEVRSTNPVAPEHLNWQSSDVTLVSVESGKIKALKEGGEAKITAQLNGKTIEARVVVESTISWDISPVIYAATQQGKVHPLTQDKVNLLPAFIATIEGSSADQVPQLTAVTEGCRFTARSSRQKWEIDAQLDETHEVLPTHCKAELTLETKAGQKLTQKLSIPLDYTKITVRESLAKDTAEGPEVATVTIRKSSSYTMKSAELKSLAEGTLNTCEWSLIEDGSNYRVIAKRESNKACAAQLVLKLQDANDGLVLTVNELVVASDAKPFEDLCVNPDNAASKLTVDVIRKEIGPSLSCDRVASFLRSKSLSVLNLKSSKFSLAFDNKNLTDLRPLARLLGLTELSLAANRKLSDISPLQDLKFLKLLNLKFTNVSDFAPIFEHNKISDLRLPVDAAVSCRAEITNPELNKICL